MFPRILLFLSLACLFMTASSTRVGFKPRSRSELLSTFQTKLPIIIPATSSQAPVRRLNHVTRSKLIDLRDNPKAKRATTSATTTAAASAATTSASNFPASNCSAYTSTGNTPWAVYTGLDISYPAAAQTPGIATREACHQLCQNMPSCVADTWKYTGVCYTLTEIDSYFPVSVNGWQGSVRGLTCDQNAAAVAASLSVKYPTYRAGTNYTCCTEYRAS